MKRGQIAMEFVLMLISLIVLITFMAWVAYYYITDYSEARNIRMVQDLGYALQNEVILSYNVEPGYVRTILVPSTLGDFPVILSSTPNEIILTYKGSDVLFRVPLIEGSFTSGANVLRKLENGSVRIN